MPSESKRGLGRGFDALIPIVEDEFDPTATKTADGKRVSADAVQEVGVDSVVPNPHQPRQVFEEKALAGLADSIRHHGILQPLIVTELSPGRFELIAGERRLRAAKLANLDTVPVIVRTFDEQQKVELALLENLQREDLNPMEIATAYQKLMDQFHLTHEEIGKRVGRDRTTVINTMRLLGLPIEAKRAISEGKITEGHGRAILTLANREKQLAFLELMLQKKWTVRQAEEFARAYRPETGSRTKGMKRLAKTNHLTKDLADYLGTKVSMMPTAKGGKLMIEYYSDEELQRIYDTIYKNV